MSANVPGDLVRGEMRDDGCDGARLTVRLAPNASRTAITGIEATKENKTVLKVAVTAIPEKGKANAALIKLLAKHLSLPKSAFRMVSGARDRNKQIFIDADPGDVMKRFAKVLEGLK